MITVGIDEVGRGCWAGPLVAGAAVFDDSFAAKDEWRIVDSKLLTRSQRTEADVHIRREALALGLGWVSSEEVDKLGLTAAVRLAMQRALEELLSTVDGGLDAIDRIVIDGSFNFLHDMPKTEAVVKADNSVVAVSAASILAKVARDRWMAEEAEKQWPGYGFARHVGYGTKVHRAALEELGICNIHRKSFRPIAAAC